VFTFGPRDRNAARVDAMRETRSGAEAGRAHGAAQGASRIDRRALR